MQCLLYPDVRRHIPALLNAAGQRQPGVGGDSQAVNPVVGDHQSLGDGLGQTLHLSVPRIPRLYTGRCSLPPGVRRPLGRLLLAWELPEGRSVSFLALKPSLWSLRGTLSNPFCKLQICVTPLLHSLQ